MDAGLISCYNQSNNRLEVKIVNDSLVYLDTYILQQDMRVRMPKTILANLNLEKGKSRFDIYLDKLNNAIVLKPCEFQPSSNKDIL